MNSLSKSKDIRHKHRLQASVLSNDRMTGSRHEVRQIILRVPPPLSFGVEGQRIGVLAPPCKLAVITICALTP